MQNPAMSDVLALVNDLLDHEREACNLTEEQLAAKWGVEPSTLWRWRKGKILSKQCRLLLPLALAAGSVQQNGHTP